jgi:hypothetical protein
MRKSGRRLCIRDQSVFCSSRRHLGSRLAAQANLHRERNLVCGALGRGNRGSDQELRAITYIMSADAAYGSKCLVQTGYYEGDKGQPYNVAPFNPKWVCPNEVRM